MEEQHLTPGHPTVEPEELQVGSQRAAAPPSRSPAGQRAEPFPWSPPPGRPASSPQSICRRHSVPGDQPLRPEPPGARSRRPPQLPGNACQGCRPRPQARPGSSCGELLCQCECLGRVISGDAGHRSVRLSPDIPGPESWYVDPVTSTPPMSTVLAEATSTGIGSGSDDRQSDMAAS